MNDLIRRQDAIDAVMSVPEGNWLSRRYAEELKEVPSARPTGKWERRFGTGALCSCSECGHNIWDVDVRIHKFCPNCGAEMRGDKDER